VVQGHLLEHRDTEWLGEQQLVLVSAVDERVVLLGDLVEIDEHLAEDNNLLGSQTLARIC